MDNKQSLLPPGVSVMDAMAQPGAGSGSGPATSAAVGGGVVVLSVAKVVAAKARNAAHFTKVTAPSRHQSCCAPTHPLTLKLRLQRKVDQRSGLNSVPVPEILRLEPTWPACLLPESGSPFPVSQSARTHAPTLTPTALSTPSPTRTHLCRTHAH